MKRPASVPDSTYGPMEGTAPDLEGLAQDGPIAAGRPAFAPWNRPPEDAAERPSPAAWQTEGAIR